MSMLVIRCFMMLQELLWQNSLSYEMVVRILMMMVKNNILRVTCLTKSCLTNQYLNSYAKNQSYQTTLKKLKRIFRSEEHTSELQSRGHLVCRLLLEKKKKKSNNSISSIT